MAVAELGNVIVEDGKRLNVVVVELGVVTRVDVVLGLREMTKGECGGRAGSCEKGEGWGEGLGAVGMVTMEVVAASAVGRGVAVVVLVATEGQMWQRLFSVL